MNYPIYNQQDPRWATHLLGNSTTLQIGRWGDLLTCLGMLAGADPLTLNDWLKAHGGFQTGAHGADLVSYDISSYAPTVKFNGVSADYSKILVPAGPLNQLILALQAGKPAIILVNHIPGVAGVTAHYVLAIGASANSQIVILDPWFGDISPFSRYGTNPAGICRWISYENLPAPASYPPPTFMAIPSQVTAGQPAALAWNAPQSTNITLNGAAVTGPQSSQQVTPAATTTYTLKVTYPDASVVTVTATVTVNPVVYPTPIFTATPDQIQAGQLTTLAWNAPQATGIYLDDGAVTGPQSSIQVKPAATTTYTLKVNYPDGSVVTKTVTVTVTPVVYPAPIFTATPDQIQAGQLTTLAWNAPQASSIYLDGAAVNGPQSSVQVKPAATTTYTLKVNYPDGSVVTKTVTVTVTPVVYPAPTFTATPDQIQAGQLTTLAWNAPQASSIYLDGAAVNGPQSSVQVKPAATTTYTLKVNYPDGSVVNKTVIVTVTPVVYPAPTFTATPNTVQAGLPTTLAWNAPQASSIYLDGASVTGPQSSVQVIPATTTTYTLKVNYPDGSVVTKTATVTVTPVVYPAPTFTVTPDTVLAGQPATLTWNAPQASGIYLDGNGVTGPQSSVQVIPTVTTTYTLKVIYPDTSVVTKTVTLTVNQPPAVTIKIGFNALADGGAARDAYAAGCRMFTMMNDTDTANWLAQQPGTTVLYRQWWNHAPSEDEAFNNLAVPRLHPLVIRIGINECEYINGNDFAWHANFDIHIAQRLRAQDSRVRYAAGTYSMGTPDFTQQWVCDAIKQYYAPAYNSGLIDWDHHLYSPTMLWIYKTTTGNTPSQTKISVGWVGRDKHIATYETDAPLPGHTLMLGETVAPAFSDNPTYQDWFETRWHFLFTRCGFDPTSSSRVYSTEWGVDEGGVGGFPAHKATDQDVVNYCRRLTEIQTAPVGLTGARSPFVGGCFFQLGYTNGAWDGYDMRRYVPAMKAAGIFP